MNSQSIEIVVAKYQEDTSWLSRLSPIIKQTVYDKGDSNAKWHLENKGRESHTYLHHITTNYDNLSDLTIFSQGASTDDVPDLLNILNTIAHNLTRILKKENIYIDLCPNIQAFHVDDSWESLDKQHTTLGAFFNHVFGITPEDKEYLCRAHASFVVHKNNILRHPKEFYLKILESVSYSADPCEGHFLERLWKTILSSPSCYDVAQKPGEWRKVTEVDGKTLKTPVLYPFEEEIKKSLFIEPPR